MTPSNARIYRVALSFWLFGWFCNAEGFLLNFADAVRFPISYALFPAVLRSPESARAVYLLPLLAVVALVRPAPAVARVTSPALAVLAFHQCVHLETCNDATFLTSFWSALWLTWFAWNGGRSDAAFRLHARALAQSAFGLMFLGAAVGKLTPEYVRGDAFYGLYFRDNNALPYRYLKAHLSPEAVRGVASWFSRFAISAELVLAAAPFLPTRFVLCGAFLTMLSMMLAWTFHLWSVLSSLFGLLVAAALIEQAEEANTPVLPS